MKRVVLVFGLISGAILAAVMLLVTVPFHDQIGNDAGLIVGYTSMVLAFMLIFFGVRSYRDNVAGGTVRFWRALRVGASIAAVASACYVATWEVVYFTVMPDFMTKYQAHEMEKARANGDSAAELAKKQAEFEKFAKLYQNPAFNVAMTFMEPLPVALVMSLVTAFALSRRKQRPVSADDIALGSRALG
jgi:hypothetical protein